MYSTVHSQYTRTPINKRTFKKHQRSIKDRSKHQRSRLPVYRCIATIKEQEQLPGKVYLIDRQQLKKSEFSPPKTSSRENWPVGPDFRPIFGPQGSIFAPYLARRLAVLARPLARRASRVESRLILFTTTTTTIAILFIYYSCEKLLFITVVVVKKKLLLTVKRKIVTSIVLPQVEILI